MTWDVFGSGGLPKSASIGSGDLVGIQENVLIVPFDYSSGDQFADSAVWEAATFTSLGLTPGTDVETWGSGLTADSFTIQVGSTETEQGGPSSAPISLFNEVDQATGTISGQGTQDYYSFNWGGGAFSATASLTGTNSGMSYLFSEGLTGGTCASGGSSTLNSSDSFTGTIAIANLGPGLYCIGLDSNSANDPSYTLTFNTPLPAQTPEPSSCFFLLIGFATLGSLPRFAQSDKRINK
jgi:hypothetical protein